MKQVKIGFADGRTYTILLSNIASKYAYQVATDANIGDEFWLDLYIPTLKEVMKGDGVVILRAMRELGWTKLERVAKLVYAEIDYDDVLCDAEPDILQVIE